MTARFVCTLTLAVCLINLPGVAETNTNGLRTFKQIIDNLLDNGTYDRTIRPMYDIGQSVRVEVDVLLNTLGPVVEREMQIGASFYLRQQWRDPRLAFNGVNQSILLNHRRVDSLWLPDLYFSQSKDEHSHTITVPNVLVRLHPDGTILYSQRLTVVFQCLMDLRKFPMDQQTCYIRMESYSHTTEDMYFAWSSSRKSMDVLENAHIPDFELTRITTHDCTATYATGTFPCLEARLELNRQIGFYMTQTYIPCILIVSLSWASFWLEPQAIPARISVGLLTVLTITTQSSGIRSGLPRVPYTKSIDVWMIVCLIFVFAAYIEYAVVTVFTRRHRKINGPYKEDGGASRSTSLADVCAKVLAANKSSNTTVSTAPNGNADSTNTSTSSGVDSAEKTTSNNNDNSSNRGRLRSLYMSSSSFSSLQRQHSLFPIDHESRDMGRVVDKWARALFPTTFILFNIGYWVYYTQSD